MAVSASMIGPSARRKYVETKAETADGSGSGRRAVKDSIGRADYNDNSRSRRVNRPSPGKDVYIEEEREEAKK